MIMMTMIRTNRQIFGVKKGDLALCWPRNEICLTSKTLQSFFFGNWMNWVKFWYNIKFDFNGSLANFGLFHPIPSISIHKKRFFSKCPIFTRVHETYFWARGDIENFNKQLCRNIRGSEILCHSAVFHIGFW